MVTKSMKAHRKYRGRFQNVTIPIAILHPQAALSGSKIPLLLYPQQPPNIYKICSLEGRHCLMAGATKKATKCHHRNQMDL